MIQAVVFDFDGVILESADCKTDAFVELYEPHGPAVVAQVRAHHLANLGISRFKKFAWIAEHVLHVPHTEADDQRLGQGFSDLALAKVLAAPFVAGAEAALAWLAARGIPAFVATGTPQPEIEMIVERRALGAAFREVHGTPREKADIVRDVLARHGWAPADVLFVGDGTSDHKAALEVGTPFLARDTPPIHDEWVKRGVKRAPDLRTFPELVASW
ncbi:MAG TPA: HAD family hydrolase [Kofleriaceae bacterium]|jgi:phosphoglycolate phosphatase-like HAD superfamily hydrolase